MNKRLFAIGDIHGCFDSLKELVENKIQLQKSDNLILLGDYIDRGDKSKEVIDFIMELQKKGFNIIPLMGNHEAMLLDALEAEKDISKWIQNGGDKTLKSFEINSLKDVESKYIDFFKGLRCYFAFENFLFVHAGFNDNVLNPFTDYYSMLWKCKESYANPLLANKTIIHGHNLISISKCEDRVLSKLDVINIDTGCVYNDKEGFGRLTAYDCNNQRILFV
ncbi:serine/threonine protein phosphatase 1 [Tangfeifania diversioriginum]|uniref:Serine/threonine protein phosphatase 1 n=1 Tax=Tangfeifania diversioriginum TaxID=1168035 RepID=A0A1M6DI15_9BACT|nr:metallophosphoesterase family protein [Tangfeifania diversioriginum]SHI72753.1 serine/threonine protein phosphatase 1 [Tangfeifania diversioriginum]